MKTIISNIFLFVVSINCISQNQFSTIEMKETFDDIFYMWSIDYSKMVKCDKVSTSISESNYKFYGDSLNSNNNLPVKLDLPNILGDQWCGMMEGLLNMYETTKDKGYLIKFINMSNYAISKRYDFINLNSTNITNPTPRWSPICYLSNCNYILDLSTTDETDTIEKYNVYPVYQDGLIIYPLARFCYMVKVKYASLLNNFHLNENVDINGLSRCIINTYNLAGLPMTYMGDYATWLAARVSETIQYYYDTNHYLPEDGEEDTEVGFYKKPLEFGNSQSLEFNKQAGFLSACLYIGAIYNNDWLDIGAAIARKIKNGTHRIRDQHESCNWPFNCCWRTRPILYEDDGALLWWHGSYHELDNCENQQQKEDLGHAFNSMNVFRTCYDINLYTNGQYLFDDPTMTKFRNLFVNKIALGIGNYSNVIDGNNGPLWEGGSSNNNPTPNSYRNHAPAFMYFYKWDSNNDLYNNLMNYYLINYMGSSAANFSSSQIAYLSYYIKAQWDKECPNLTLRNRYLNYNQNFVSKNNLIVDPSLKKPLCDNSKEYGSEYYPLGKNDPRSFFDPIITEPIFAIASGVNCNMIAANEITFKPGFEVKSGAEFNAKINSSLCSPGIPNAGRFANDSLFADLNLKQNPTISEPKKTFRKSTPKPQELSIDNVNEISADYLSVNFAANNIFIKSSSNISRVWVYDASGKLIKSLSNINKQTIEISLDELKTGLYIVKAQNNIKVQTQMLSIIKN